MAEDPNKRWHTRGPIDEAGLKRAGEALKRHVEEKAARRAARKAQLRGEPEPDLPELPELPAEGLDVVAEFRKK